MTDMKSVDAAKNATAVGMALHTLANDMGWATVIRGVQQFVMGLPESQGGCELDDDTDRVEALLAELATAIDTFVNRAEEERHVR
jgi:hypothetical protein